jgi:hypothetical protein
MTPHDAAQRFVGLVVRATSYDVLDLVEPNDGNLEPNARAQHAAYIEVETAVRRQSGATHDLDALKDTVRLAATKGERDDILIAVSKLMGAFYDELTVKQHSAYVVGLTVGRALHASASGELGGGWRAGTP